MTRVLRMKQDAAGAYRQKIGSAVGIEIARCERVETRLRIELCRRSELSVRAWLLQKQRNIPFGVGHSDVSQLIPVDVGLCEECSAPAGIKGACGQECTVRRRVLEQDRGAAASAVHRTRVHNG